MSERCQWKYLVRKHERPIKLAGECLERMYRRLLEVLRDGRLSATMVPVISVNLFSHTALTDCGQLEWLGDAQKAGLVLRVEVVGSRWWSRQEQLQETVA